MGHALMRRLKQTRPPSGPAEEAVLNVLLAASWVNDRVEQALKDIGISHAQFNVLRILRGARPGGLPRCDVACRMIDRAPDVTRLIDRLERRKLVERGRDAEDARRSVSRITRAGLGLLERADQALAPVGLEVARRLRASELHELSRLSESLYAPDVEGE